MIKKPTNINIIEEYGKHVDFIAKIDDHLERMRQNKIKNDTLDKTRKTHFTYEEPCSDCPYPASRHCCDDVANGEIKI